MAGVVGRETEGVDGREAASGALADVGATLGVALLGTASAATPELGVRLGKGAIAALVGAVVAITSGEAGAGEAVGRGAD